MAMPAATADERSEKLKALEREVNDQLFDIGRQLGQLEAVRSRATKDQRADIDRTRRALKRRSAQLGDAYLENVASILDVDGVLKQTKELTIRIKEEADTMGGVATLLKTASAILGLANSSIKLFKNAK